MALTKHRIPNIEHDAGCCGVHDVDKMLHPMIACVDLDWIVYMSHKGPVLIDGVQCEPSKFYTEAKRYEPINTSNWNLFPEDDEEIPDNLDDEETQDA